MSDSQSGDGVSPPQDGGGERQGQQQTPAAGPLNWSKVMELISARKVDVSLWAIRLLTLILAVGYIFPVFGNPVSTYYKALLASAATSALRLHQRLPVVTFSRAFVGQLLIEDSCHYLFYSLIFIYSSPLTLVLVPTVMFAFLHFASFSLTLLDSVGRNSSWIARILISLIEYKTVTILRMAAGAEIFIMAFAILYPILGRASLITPFLYYRFLALRYTSRRNHYTRTMFYELRVWVDSFANSGKCPGILSKLIQKGIRVIGCLSPAVPTNAS